MKCKTCDGTGVVTDRMINGDTKQGFCPDCNKNWQGKTLGRREE